MIEITTEVIDEAILRYETAHQRSSPAPFVESAALVGEIATIVKTANGPITQTELGRFLCAAFQAGFECALMLPAGQKQLVH